jgi:hypothetical protein
MSKYTERLSTDDKQVKAEEIKLAGANAKAQVEQEISRLTAQSATLEAAFNAALGNKSFSLPKVLSLSKEKSQNSADLEFAKTLLATEFAD